MGAAEEVSSVLPAARPAPPPAPPRSAVGCSAPPAEPKYRRLRSRARPGPAHWPRRAALRPVAKAVAGLRGVTVRPGLAVPQRSVVRFRRLVAGSWLWHGDRSVWARQGYPEREGSSSARTSKRALQLKRKQKKSNVHDRKNALDLAGGLYVSENFVIPQGNEHSSNFRNLCAI